MPARIGVSGLWHETNTFRLPRSSLVEHSCQKQSIAPGQLTWGYRLKGKVKPRGIEFMYHEICAAFAPAGESEENTLAMDRDRSFAFRFEAQPCLTDGFQIGCRRKDRKVTVVDTSVEKISDVDKFA